MGPLLILSFWILVRAVMSLVFRLPDSFLRMVFISLGSLVSLLDWVPAYVVCWIIAVVDVATRLAFVDRKVTSERQAFAIRTVGWGEAALGLMFLYVYFQVRHIVHA